MKNLLVTGYRAHELGIFSQKHMGIAYIQTAFERRLRHLVEEGVEWLISPGQYGVDLWAIEVGIKLKQDYPQLKVSILSAYHNPAENWKEDRQNYFQMLLRDVDYYTSVSKEPYNGVWQLQARDDLLLRKTDGMLLFYDEEAAEGSPKFYRDKALRKQAKEEYPIITISAEEIQSIADEHYE